MFKFTVSPFLKIAVGLPVLLVGLSLILMKTGESISVIARPERLKASCILCRMGDGGH